MVELDPLELEVILENRDVMEGEVVRFLIAGFRERVFRNAVEDMV